MNVIGKLWFACRNATDRLNFWRKSVASQLHDSLLRQLTKGRPPIGLPVILAIALVAIAWAASATAAPCYRYGQVVTLSGHYFTQVAPVDDGVVRDPLNDAARRATLLRVTTPFCVDADSVSVGIAVASTVQLNCPAVHPADGSELSIKGRLVGAHTGNGQTPVLLACP